MLSIKNLATWIPPGYSQDGRRSSFIILVAVFVVSCILFLHLKVADVEQVEFLGNPLHEIQHYSVSSYHQNVYQELSRPPAYMQTLNRSTLDVKDLVIVTFISENHVAESIISCITIQQVPELNKTLFYVFIADDVSDAVVNIYQEICQIAVVIKYSDIAKELGPEFMELRNSYRFKPLVVVHILRLHPIVLFADASIRFDQSETNSWSKTIKNVLVSSSVDLAMLGTVAHFMYPATHPSMYKFFPEVDVEKMKETEQQQSYCTMFFGTPVGWKLAMRYLKCAFEPDCLAPPNSTSHGCDMSKIYSEPNKFSGCHRYDQSALNLIGYAEALGNFSLYAYDTDLFHVIRNPNF